MFEISRENFRNNLEKVSSQALFLGLAKNFKHTRKNNEKMRFIIWLTGSGRLAQECNSRFESGVGFIQVSSKTDQKTINSFFTSKSPNYPSPYPPNIDCSWTIGSNPTDSVILTAGKMIKTYFVLFDIFSQMIN